MAIFSSPFDAGPDLIRRNSLTLYFVLACGISWTLWAPLWLPRLGLTGLPVLPFHHTLGAAGPIAAAFMIAALESGKAGVADLARRMALWRGAGYWVVIALVGPLAVLAMAVLGARLLAGEAVSLEGIGVSREFPRLSFLGLMLYNVASFGYGEETGWRGFALPRLQARHTALVATVLLTIGWAVWHVPLFLYRPGYAGMGVLAVVGWLLSLCTGALVLTWLFNGSRGSILVVALFHAMVDVVFTSDIASVFVVNAAGGLLTLWGVVALAVFGPRYLSRQGKVSWSREQQRLVLETRGE